MLHMPTPLLLGGSPFVAAPGQVQWTGTSSSGAWTVPAGVFAICIVAIGRGSAPPGFNNGAGGGGALFCANNINTTPGEVLDWAIGARTSLKRAGTELCAADGGNGRSGGSTGVGDFGYRGGNGNSYTGSAEGGGAANYDSAGRDGRSFDYNSSKGGAGQSLLGGAGALATLASGINGGNLGGGGGVEGGDTLGSGSSGGLRILWGAGRYFPNTNTGDF